MSTPYNTLGSAVRVMMRSPLVVLGFIKLIITALSDIVQPCVLLFDRISTLHVKEATKANTSTAALGAAFAADRSAAALRNVLKCIIEKE